MKKLAIVTTHPIQYYAPVFKMLHERAEIGIRVFYTIGQEDEERFDRGFGQTITWDLPLLEGYPHEFLRNTSSNPGSHHFNGIINPDLIGRVETYMADAVLFFGWAYQSHLKAIRYFKGRRKVYFRGDSTLLDSKSAIPQLLKSFLLTWVYSHVDHAFFVGTNNKAYFERYGLKINQLTFAPHAVDNARFAIDRSDEAAELRQSLGVDENQVLILFAGKLTAKKSPFLLLEAFQNTKNSSAHLLFVGDGELSAQIRTRASNDVRVHFMGFQNQRYMPVVYQACDLFCLPSKGPGETWGLAVNEAMACGKVVLVSDKVGCAADLVKDNGVVFKHDDAEHLSGFLTKLITTGPKLADLGKHSKIIIETWNFTAIAEAVEKKLLDEKI